MKEFIFIYVYEPWISLRFLHNKTPVLFLYYILYSWHTFAVISYLKDKSSVVSVTSHMDVARIQFEKRKNSQGTSISLNSICFGVFASNYSELINWQSFTTVHFQICYVSSQVYSPGILINQTRKPKTDVYRHVDVMKHCRRTVHISKLKIIFIFRPFDIGQ